jgi:hypothetical protein
VDHESLEGPGHLVLDLNIGLDPFLRVTDLNSTRPPLVISYAVVPPDAQTPDP